MSYGLVGNVRMDPFHILGISQGASEREIRQSYKALAFKWHPDRNPDCGIECKVRMQEINEAFEKLKESGFSPTQSDIASEQWAEIFENLSLHASFEWLRSYQSNEGQTNQKKRKQRRGDKWRNAEL